MKRERRISSSLEDRISMLKKETKNYIVASKTHRRRVLFGIPSLSMIRIEFHLSFMGMIIPTNWSQASYVHIMPNYSPLRFLVADARNLIVQKAVQDGFEWLIFFDHDIVLPSNTLVKFNQYMLSNDVPIVGGLYFSKGVPADPLVYRGRGNSYYKDWHLGDKVWVDGMGLGCHLIHGSILKAIYDASPVYSIEQGINARKIFDSPYGELTDEDGNFRMIATEDLPFYDRLKEDGLLAKAGWPKYQKKKYPYLCDTSIFAAHINEQGIRYPSKGEEEQFKRKRK